MYNISINNIECNNKYISHNFSMKNQLIFKVHIAYDKNENIA